MIVGICGDLLRETVSSPIILVNSSSTILMICCPGFKLSWTSLPKASFFIFLIKSFTTLKLTSASNKANRISRLASLISASEILPLPVKFFNAF